MAVEIERKFKVASDSWRDSVTRSTSLRQGYVSTKPEATVRVRLENGVGTLTIKSKTKGISRSEFEYDIPNSEATQLLQLCEGPLIEKIRHLVIIGEHTWEIDEFIGDNQGLIIAEIELSSEDESFEKPAWLGIEVSHDARYYNSSLVAHPYNQW
ncbi:MAG: adenylate cyclase [Pseudoalteromonas distincta]|jgi:adenylate cyclase